MNLPARKKEKYNLFESFYQLLHLVHTGHHPQRPLAGRNYGRRRIGEDQHFPQAVLVKSIQAALQYIVQTAGAEGVTRPCRLYRIFL